MALLNRIIRFGVLLAIFIAAPASAEEYEYKDYTVQKGDTLWDISGAELRDNFQWPLIWKENLRINNPDLIYPGQTIKVPVSVILPGEKYLKRPVTEEVAAPEPMEEEAPAEEAAEPIEAAAPAPEPTAATMAEPEETAPKAPVKGKYIATSQTILESGYITRDTPYKGKITGSHLGKKVFGQFDEIYVSTVNPATKGQKFYVIRRESKVKHPVTGRRLGYVVRVLGLIELDEEGTRGLKARVLKSFENMNVGDPLDDYYEVEAPYVVGEPRKPDIDAFVVASTYMKEISSGFETVFIDKGRADGVLEGDMLMTLLQGTDDRRNAIIQIVNVRETTSLAYVVSSEMPIRMGDVVLGIR